MEMNTNTLKIGFIITMYSEIEKVLKNIDVIKKEGCQIIVIQSDPKDNDKLLDKNKVDFYELLPDVGGSQEQYVKERTLTSGSTIPARAITRNYGRGFTISKIFDADWWVAIFGDVSISNLSGIKKTINIMIKKNKILAITRPIGQTLYDENGKLSSYQNSDTTTFTPTFFIVKSTAIKQGLFNNIKITNPYTTEQCFGDEVKNFCNTNSINFYESCYFISDEAYPDFIKGLKYNYQQPKTPRFLRRFKKYLKS